MRICSNCKAEVFSEHRVEYPSQTLLYEHFRCFNCNKIVTYRTQMPRGNRWVNGLGVESMAFSGEIVCPTTKSVRLAGRNHSIVRSTIKGERDEQR